MSHTPGPWTFRIEREADVNSSARFFIDAKAGTTRGRWVIAETKALPPRATEEAEANAQLMAAAPDMLAALKHAENHCPCGARPESPHTHPHVISCPIGDAIAKAEGR